ncbi:DUF4998 domain-containing protein [Flavivirga sp. 57AJ16]|uniref:DUF4998 domain-containing protein n=1 Tax=Flavivirga sp. 57AJ16 TaxID=3025307 RepID=UPI0023661FE7|nr:DUF4998 domain-containing protein [Flavivirga sp. 57AJ16]MDD7885136.1 DUF4998 domain-containing protein [Flavivirga sp. 57AJ16]
MKTHLYKTNLRKNNSMVGAQNYLKINILKITYIVCFTFLLFGMGACSDMNDLHKPYLDEGEYIYAEKVDTVITGSGRERIQLSMHLSSENIETMRVFWNNNLDSIDIEIGKQKGVFNKIIENLDEQQYVFKFISIDRNGNKSLPYEAEGTVYGDNFQSQLFNRKIISGKFTNTNELTINWTVANVDVLLSSLTYIDINDALVTKEVLPTEEISVLPNYASHLMYNTAFLPNETAIDTFYTESVAFNKILLVNSEWTIVDFSSEEANGEGPNNGFASDAIDGNLDSFWHSQWQGGSPNYPHYFTIDLGSVKTITNFEIFRRRGNDGGAITHEFWVSSDNVTFAKAATLYAKLESDNGYIVDADDDTVGRYVKYVAVEGPNNYTHLGEINIYGN